MMFLAPDPLRKHEVIIAELVLEAFTGAAGNYKICNLACSFAEHWEACCDYLTSHPNSPAQTSDLFSPLRILFSNPFLRVPPSSPPNSDFKDLGRRLEHPKTRFKVARVNSSIPFSILGTSFPRPTTTSTAKLST